MADAARSFGVTLLDALLPTRCVACAAPVGSRSALRPQAFCAPCEQALPWWRRADGCPRCGTRGESSRGCAGCLAATSPLQACHAALRYTGDVRRWIPAVKRTGGRAAPSVAVLRAIDELGGALAERVRRDAAGRIDVVTSLPLHASRVRERGFNQADLLARPLAKALGLPFRPDLLERVRATAPQAALRGPARDANVRGAFRATRPLPGDLRVALVDDVLTTGASLESAAAALLDAGVLEVRGVALAATLPPDARRPRRRAPRNRAA